MKPLRSSLLSFVFILLLSSCNSDSKKPETKETKIKEEVVTYKVDSLNMTSYVMYDENIEGKRPAVLVVHEWWGLNDYIKRRARMLAELGYIAMAVDMYGNGQMGTDVASASALTAPFSQNPQIAKKRFDAAIENFKKNSMVDTSKIAAMGYCFGGGVVLGVSRMGEDLKGVVSFHGGLNQVPPVKGLLKADVLVCHGEADSFIPQTEVDKFKKQMDSIGKSYTFKSYPGATHAFSNPDATELGKKFNIPIAYNAAADTASWNDMKNFFNRIFK